VTGIEREAPDGEGSLRLHRYELLLSLAASDRTEIAAGAWDRRGKESYLAP